MIRTIARSMTMKAVLLVVGLMVVLAGSIAMTSYMTLRERIFAQIETDTSAAVRTAAINLRAGLPTVKLEFSDHSIEKIQAFAIPAFTSHTVVDTAGEAYAGQATIYAWDQARQDFSVRSTTIINADGDRAVGEVLGTLHPASVSLKDGQPFRATKRENGVSYRMHYEPILSMSGDTIGAIAIGFPIDPLLQTLDRTRNSVLLGAGAAIFVLGGAAFFILRRALRPLKDVTAAIHSINQGDLDTTVPHVGRSDELGEITRALDYLRETALRERQREQEDKAKARQQLARSEFIAQASNTFEQSMSETLARVREAISAINNEARLLGGSAADTVTRLEEASNASEMAATAVNSVAGASEQLTSSIDEIRRQVENCTNIATRAVDEAQGTASEVEQLDEAGRKIGEVVELINAIAEQTNLLALNATIEAARAGEAGRGFAVVAQEVKNLATQTAKATDDITDQIGRMQQATASTVKAIGNISQTIRDLEEVATTIASAIEQQASATTEIARAAEHASSGSGTAQDRLTSVSATASQTEATSRTLTAAAEILVERAESMSNDINSFLRQVAQG